MSASPSTTPAWPPRAIGSTSSPRSPCIIPRPPTTAGARGSTGVAGGQMGRDFIFLPTSPHQVASARRLLEGDRSTLAAPFGAAVFIAYFRSAERGRTDLVFASTGDSAAAVLWDRTGDPVRRGAGPGPFGLSAPPGPLPPRFHP